MPHQLLLADVSVTIQRIIRLTFADEDVDVVTVNDGNRAVATIDGSPPDIVLADVALPGCNGYDIARHLRDRPLLAHIPVVLLTDVFNKIDEARASAVGCDRVLSKPFDPQVVISCVRELLARPKKIVTPGPPLEPVEQVASAAAPPADSDAYLDQLDLTLAGLAVPFSSATSQLDPLSIEIVDPLEPEATLTDGLSVSPLALSHASERAAFDHPSGLVAHESSPPEREGASQATGIPSLFRVADDSTTAASISDELVDEIATRVLDRLMARLSADTVPDIVTAAAERLVRAEIDTIKSRL